MKEVFYGKISNKEISYRKQKRRMEAFDSSFVKNMKQFYSIAAGINEY